MKDSEPESNWGRVVKSEDPESHQHTKFNLMEIYYLSCVCLSPLKSSRAVTIHLRLTCDRRLINDCQINKHKNRQMDEVTNKVINGGIYSKCP